MNTNENDSKLTETSSKESAIPVATVSQVQSIATRTITGSRMWLLTLLCLLIAVGLIWWSLPEQGHHISIHFPDGHGLEAEDVVRFRGIDVGVVEQVRLNQELSGVDVDVILKPFAEPLAKEGTRFWIVRPRLSFTGVSGLETAVGHKYIALIPGDLNASRTTEFKGLDDPPPDALQENGIELVLRGDKKYGVNPGSPVTCRGIEIGRVLSIGLSSDARFVDARIKIFEEFTSLVSSHTKFWATSGIDVDFSLGRGLKLDAESLETIAKGGVSMLTIASEGDAIQPGQIFELNAEADDEWIEMAKSVRSTEIPLRGAVAMTMRWQQKGLLGKSNRERLVNGIPVTYKGQTYVIVTTDAMKFPRKALPDTIQMAPLESDKSIKISPESASESEPMVLIGVPNSFSEDWLDAEGDLRAAETPEDCVAVRATKTDDGSRVLLHYSIERQDIDNQWNLSRFDGDRPIWNGATILSNEDGKVIGLLSTERLRAKIIPVDPKNLQ